MKRFILGFALSAALTANAAVITSLPSTFEGDAAALDVNGVLSDGWTVNPTIDVVGPDFHGLTCHGGIRCLDMTGTTGAAGRILGHIDGTAGDTYVVSFWLSGSQRNFGFNTLTDTVEATIEGITTSYTLNWDAPWQRFEVTTVAANNGAINIRFSGTGRDDVGLLLDDVNVHTPEPATLGIAGLMIFVGLIGRRRKHQNKGDLF